MQLSDDSPSNVLSSIKHKCMKKLYYMSPIFIASDFQDTAQIEKDFRFLEPIKEIPLPKGTWVSPMDKRTINY